MSVSFERLSRGPLLSTRVAEYLLKQISSGQLKPGDRLPTEHGLSAEFGVSRNVVREAVAHLRNEGVLESRHGIGVFVSLAGAQGSFRIDANDLDDRRSLRNLFELRAIIEIETTALAAVRASKEDFATIDAALNRMKRLEMWGEDGIEADLDFHVAIAGATGNEHIKTLLRYIGAHMRSSIAETRAKSTSLAKTIQVTVSEHEAIFEALTKRDVELSSDSMRRHVENGAKRLGLSLEMPHG